MPGAFPYTVAYLPRTKLAYVNLPGVLHDGKRDRSARVPGFVAVQLGEFCYLMFLRAGEPFQAGVLGPDRRGLLPIAEVVRRAAAENERGEAGAIGYYGAPEHQLRAMLATLAQPEVPLPAEVASRPERLFPYLQGERASGVLELVDDHGWHYLCFRDGELEGVYLAERPPQLSAAQFLEAMFARRPPQVRWFPPLERLPDQAPPTLVELYQRLVNRLARELQPLLGPDLEPLLARTHATVAAQHPALAAIAPPPHPPPSPPLVAAEDLGEAVAAWLVDLLDEARGRARFDPMDLLARAAAEDRFALDQQRLWARLPWPLPI